MSFDAQIFSFLPVPSVSCLRTHRHAYCHSLVYFLGYSQISVSPNPIFVCLFLSFCLSVKLLDQQINKTFRLTECSFTLQTGRVFPGEDEQKQKPVGNVAHGSGRSRRHTQGLVGDRPGSWRRLQHTESALLWRVEGSKVHGGLSAARGPGCTAATYWALNLSEPQFPHFIYLTNTGCQTLF